MVYNHRTVCLVAFIVVNLSVHLYKRVIEGLIFRIVGYIVVGYRESVVIQIFIYDKYRYIVNNIICITVKHKIPPYKNFVCEISGADF